MEVTGRQQTGGPMLCARLEKCIFAYYCRVTHMPGGNRAGKRKPDGTLLKTYGKSDGITLGEMQDTAKHVIELVMKLK